MKSSAHPGGALNSGFGKPLNRSVKVAASVLGVTRETFTTVFNEHSPLLSGLALRIEKTFGVSMDTLMRMQRSYNMAKAGKRGIKANGYRLATDDVTLI